MYDVLSGRYTFSCPSREQSAVPLSSFRRLERLPGAAHPSVFRVRFACGCGEEHDGLVAHDDLDWAPLGVGEGRAFLNLMTDRLEDVGAELADLAARHIGGGRWPWTFFCYPEARPRPVFPSLFTLIEPAGPGGEVGMLARCPVCARFSLNLVSREHLDVPFRNDRAVGVVEHVFAVDEETTVEEFRAELWSASFDRRRERL